MPSGPGKTCGRATYGRSDFTCARTLLKRGAVTLATPVAAAIAQPGRGDQGIRRRKTFDLWVISDSACRNRQAANRSIHTAGSISAQPRLSPSPLATALRHLRAGGPYGGRSSTGIIALISVDYVCGGLWDGTEGRAGAARWCVRYSVLKRQSPRAGLQYRRQPRTAAPTGTPRTRAGEPTLVSANGADPGGEHTETYGVDP